MALTARAARWRAAAPALALLAASGLSLGATSASPAQAQTAACDSVQRTQGFFRSVAKPALLPGSLTAHAVEPSDPRVVYLADQSRVAVSRDAGCTWELALELPSAPSTAISSLTVPDTGSPSGRLLVVSTTAAVPGTDESGAVSTVHSRRGEGQPFRQSASVPGRVRPAVAAGDPDVVYLATSDQGQAGLGPLRSTDGGATFTPTRGTRTLPPSDGGAVDEAPRHVAVDPDVRDTVLVGSASLQRSADGGSSFGVVLGRPDVRYAHALAAHGRGGAAAGTVALVATGNRTSGLADSSAEIWSVPRTGEPRSLPTAGLKGVPQSLAAGRTADELVLTVADLKRGVGDGYEGSGSLYLLDAARQTWVDVMDRRGYPLLDAQLDRSADPAIHLHSSSLSDPLGADEYVVYDPPAEGRVVPPAPGEGSPTPEAPPADAFPPPPGACPTAPVFEPPATRQSASRLTPGQARLPVDAAGGATHQLDLDLVGDAAALDLVVLLDTSDSMGPAAEGIVCGLEGLVTGLAADGVDLRVGLAEFWDAAPGTRYQRLVDLAPPGRDVQRALRSVRTRGGEEAHRSALVQAVTGRGLVVGGRQIIRPGQGMSLRDGALKVVLHVTDEPWSPQTEFEPSPFEVVDTLNAADVKHVGLQVLQDAQIPLGSDRVDGLVGQPLLRAQLDQFSAGTGAFAPAAGVDCDGDGTRDLSEGDPLVCTGRVRGGIVPDVGAAVRSLVEALPVRGPVTLRPTPTDDVQVQVATRYDDVDLRAAARFAFPLQLACRPGAAGPVPVGFEALAGPLVVSTASAVVLCPSRPGAPVAADPPPEPAPVLAAAPQGPSAAAAAAPPVPPPPAVQVPAPAPGAAAGAVAGAAGSAGAGASSSVSALGSVSQAAGSSVTGLAGAPKETVRQAAEVSVSATGEDASLDAVPLAAVPLAAGVVSTAALATHLIATRRRPRPRTAEEHLRRR